MKQTRFQRKKKLKRAQFVIKKYVDHYLGTLEGQKVIYDAYFYAVINGYVMDDKVPEVNKLRD